VIVTAVAIAAAVKMRVIEIMSKPPGILRAVLLLFLPMTSR